VILKDQDAVAVVAALPATTIRCWAYAAFFLGLSFCLWFCLFSFISF